MEMISYTGWVIGGKAKIDEVYHIDERIYFKSIDEDELIERRADLIFCEEYPNHKHLNDEESKRVTKTATDYVRDLDWEKVITVRIEPPY